jgi:hypothetical protein
MSTTWTEFMEHVSDQTLINHCTTRSMSYELCSEKVNVHLSLWPRGRDVPTLSSKLDEHGTEGLVSPSPAALTLRMEILVPTR